MKYTEPLYMKLTQNELHCLTHSLIITVTRSLRTSPSAAAALLAPSKVGCRRGQLGHLLLHLYAVESGQALCIGESFPRSGDKSWNLTDLTWFRCVCPRDNHWHGTGITHGQSGLWVQK